MLDVDPRAGAPEPSLSDSLIRVLEVGQRVLLDRIDLARFDVSQAARRLLSGVALLAIGAMLLTGGWFMLMGGVVSWLQLRLSLPVSLVLAAVLTAALGAGALAVGVRRMHTEESSGAAPSPAATEHDASNGGSAPR
jgi:hypothetical protein